MKGVIGSVIAWVVLFGVRIGLEFLAEQYEFFGQWLIIATIALIAVSVVLVSAFAAYLVQQWSEIKNLFRKSDTEQTARSSAGKRSKASGSTWTERRAAKAARKEALRAKIQRIEAYEKRWSREKGGK